jgi:hypothetical protein
MPPNKHSDCVKTYGGVGCAIGGGFNLASVKNIAKEKDWHLPRKMV